MIQQILGQGNLTSQQQSELQNILRQVRSGNLRSSGRGRSSIPPTRRRHGKTLGKKNVRRKPARKMKRGGRTMNNKRNRY